MCKSGWRLWYCILVLTPNSLATVWNLCACLPRSSDPTSFLAFIIDLANVGVSQTWACGYLYSVQDLGNQLKQFEICERLIAKKMFARYDQAKAPAQNTAAAPPPKISTPSWHFRLSTPCTRLILWTWERTVHVFMRDQYALAIRYAIIVVIIAH